MPPLTPNDLLIRHNPVEMGRWVDGGDATPQATRLVSLERFQLLEQALRDNPIHSEPYLELAKIYLQNSRWVDAKRVLDLACNRFPDHEEIQFLREEAQLARALQLHWEAQKEYKAEPTRLTEEPLQRAGVELNVVRERVCRARLARHPADTYLNLPLAVALHNLGNSDAAIRLLATTSQEAKLRAEACLQLGGILESGQRIPEALSAYRKAAMFRVPPPSAEVRAGALRAAAQLAERHNLVDSARRYLAMLVEIEPENKDYQARLQQLKNAPL